MAADPRHRIADEYHEVNPARVRLVEPLTEPDGQAGVVVVGDDDQAIDQRRGSHRAAIVTVASRVGA